MGVGLAVPYNVLSPRLVLREYFLPVGKNLHSTRILQQRDSVPIEMLKRRYADQKVGDGHGICGATFLTGGGEVELGG